MGTFVGVGMGYTLTVNHLAIPIQKIFRNKLNAWIEKAEERQPHKMLICCKRCLSVETLVKISSFVLHSYVPFQKKNL